MPEEFDYIVVGAGSSGAPLAARLSEEPDARVLLEAGGNRGGQNVRIPAAFAKLFKTYRDWNYSTEPQPGLGDRRVYWPRGKMLDDCSSMNAMVWMRGFVADHERWVEAAGDDGWGWESVQAYFHRIEDGERSGSYLARGGPQAISPQRSPSPLTEEFLTACVEAGLPRSAPEEINGPAPDGFNKALLTQRRGARFSTVDAYLAPARRRGNLTVRTGAQAQRVLIEHGRATGVHYRHGGGEHTRAARKVVLSSGTVNSPQQLMLSGIGPGHHLREHGIDTLVDAPEVGSNLQDYVFAPIVVGCDAAPTLYRAEPPAQLLRFLLRRKGMLTSNVAEAYGLTRSSPELSLPDLELLFAPGAVRRRGAESVQRRRGERGSGAAATRQHRHRHPRLARPGSRLADRPTLSFRSRGHRPRRVARRPGDRREGARRSVAYPAIHGANTARRGHGPEPSPCGAGTPRAHPVPPDLDLPDGQRRAVRSGSRTARSRRAGCGWPTRPLCRGSSAATPTRPA